MTAALILTFAIELALFIYTSTNCANTNNPYVNTSLDVNSASASTCHTSLFAMLIEPSIITGNALFSTFLGRIGAIASLALFIVGFFFIIRIETAYAYVAVAFLSFMFVIAQLWGVISGQGWFGDQSGIVASILMFPLFIFYVMACFDWIRQPG